MAQLAEVAGSLTSYQTNLQQKIQDIRGLSEGGGAVSRFMAMVASLGHDLALTTGPAPAPAVRVQSGGSNFASVAAFVAPLLHPLLTIGIVVILVVFILLDRDHLSDQFVRLFGASDVHATSEAIGDAGEPGRPRAVAAVDDQFRLCRRWSASAFSRSACPTRSCGACWPAGCASCPMSARPSAPCCPP